MTSSGTAITTTALGSVPIFASFTPEQLRALSGIIMRRSVTRGMALMREGDVADCLYVVMSGRVKVMMGEADGKETILSILGPGDFCGEMGLIDDNPRSASVIAIEACELLALTRQAFRKCLVENAGLAMAVMRVLVRRLREADRKIGSLAMLDVYGRVARLLLDMSDIVDGKRVVTRRLTKQDIAKMIGASREMVHKVMKDLQTSGYIELQGSSIVLRDAKLPSH
jgi:CRP/FNR family transcriptional regulator, cyclic AMP receptor protein